MDVIGWSMYEVLYKFIPRGTRGLERQVPEVTKLLNAVVVVHESNRNGQSTFQTACDEVKYKRLQWRPSYIQPMAKMGKRLPL
jgi:hypothetical protein